MNGAPAAEDLATRQLQFRVSRNLPLARELLQALPPSVWISPAGRVHLVALHQLTQLLVRALPPVEEVKCLQLKSVTRPTTRDWEMLGLLGKVIASDLDLAAWLLAPGHWDLWTNGRSPTQSAADLGRWFGLRREAGRNLKTQAMTRLGTGEERASGQKESTDAEAASS